MAFICAISIWCYSLLSQAIMFFFLQFRKSSRGVSEIPFGKFCLVGCFKESLLVPMSSCTFKKIKKNFIYRVRDFRFVLEIFVHRILFWLSSRRWIYSKVCTCVSLSLKSLKPFTIIYIFLPCS